jgi:hypothetical protein
VVSEGGEVIPLIRTQNFKVLAGTYRRPGAFWFSPLTLVKSERPENLLTVFGLLLLWGWDRETPLSILPRGKLVRRMAGKEKNMLDVALFLSWAGFAIVFHSTAETPQGGEA